MKFDRILLLIISAFTAVNTHRTPTLADDLHHDKIHRKLSVKFNPGCPDTICKDSVNKDILNLVHVTADSSKDRLHHVWSFVGKPSVLIALGSLDSRLTIDWYSLLGLNGTREKSVTITPEPEYALITVLNRVFEFNDPEDRGGNFVNVSDKDILSLDSNKFTYQYEKLMKVKEPDAFVQLKVAAIKYNKDNSSTNIGFINFTLDAYSNKGHGAGFPHLLHNSNASQIDIVFDNFKIKKSFKGPRLAMEFMFATTDRLDSNATFKITKRRTLDDEHTPGIFELDNLMSRRSYVEYRPVSYTHDSRDVSTATDTHLGKIITPTSTLVDGSLIYAYFGYNAQHLVQGVNISFGSVNDGFYGKTNYTSFTFLTGIGEPPTEELSQLLIVIGLIGMGIPVLLLILGGTCICVKRVRTYQRLANGYVS